MSLDCYPFGETRAIDLSEQPISLDVVYDDDLLILVVDHCKSLSVFDLRDLRLIRKLQLGDDKVIDRVVYCKTGDYLACVVYKQDQVSVEIISSWRDPKQEPVIDELDLNQMEQRSSVDSVESRAGLNSIDCCQRTGNLAVSFGDHINIFRYVDGSQQENTSATDRVATDLYDDDEETMQADRFNSIMRGIELDSSDAAQKPRRGSLEHIISVKISIYAAKVSLMENYLAITAVDHVQVLKLELLTIQIQHDYHEQPTDQHPLQGFRILLGQGNNYTGSNTNVNININLINNNNNLNSILSNGYGSYPSEVISDAATTATCSLMSNSNSTTTNLSSANFNINSTTSQRLNNSELSIITINNHVGDEYEANVSSSKSSDGCITWNLNTKKLVKLPTLMHNTSTNLSSYHVCHPFELLGPASESIACRVSASIYSPHYRQNQLEAVVMLCKQVDFDKDPVKSTHLHGLYLSSAEDQRRLRRGVFSTSGDKTDLQASGQEAGILKSNQHHLLASVTCLVSTLTSCHVYSLQGKKVTKLQRITHPDLCLSLRPDLLNVYLLTPIGLQICSIGASDSIFRYDWSSSSDLNLSFMATTNVIHVITSDRYAILMAEGSYGRCEARIMRKPTIGALFDRILHTTNRCQSISVRSNLLTYLHAICQMELIRPSTSGCDTLMADDSSAKSILKAVTVVLCEQLKQKKQDNIITNGYIDKTIKHLLDISYCDLIDLLQYPEVRVKPLASMQKCDSMVFARISARQVSLLKYEVLT